jgi:hypothetical protein
MVSLENLFQINQSLNTLHGLNNRLVLRDKASDRRSVLLQYLMAVRQSRELEYDT